MKGIRIKAALAALICVFALPMTGCTKEGVASLTSDELAQVVNPDLQISVVGSEEVQLTETIPAGTDATTSATTTVTTVTDAQGNKFVAVTDTQGSAVTDAQGQNVTQPYVETTTASGADASSTTTTLTTAAPITALMETRQALWWNIAKKSDYLFEGNFLKFTFKVKEGTVAGNYPVKIVQTDFANYDAKTLAADSIEGYVSIGGAVAPAQGTPVSGAFTVTAVNASGNVGDTVDVYFAFTNNPGIAGCDFRFQYDSNALEYVSGGFTSEFSAILK